MKTEITSIKLKVGEREFELTADEARQLHSELGKLFTHSLLLPIGFHRDPYPHIPPPVYPTPIWVEPYQPWWQPNWQVTCGTTTGSANSVLCINA